MRESTRNVGDFVLSLMCEGKVQHYIIVVRDPSNYILLSLSIYFSFPLSPSLCPMMMDSVPLSIHRTYYVHFVLHHKFISITRPTSNTYIFSLHPMSSFKITCTTSMMVQSLLLSTNWYESKNDCNKIWNRSNLPLYHPLQL